LQQTLNFKTRCCNQLFLMLAVMLLLTGTKNTIAQDYFQQEVNHTIFVSLNDKLHQLDAFQTVEYINHSPDTLLFIYFHLWPNAYSNNRTALAKQLLRMQGKKKLFKQPSLSGSIDSLDFRTNDKKLQWQFIGDTIDICKVFLAEPLQPGDSVKITTPFKVKIPKGVSSRLGHIGESYQLSQWYPKPAVYDLTGWHPMQYLDQGEFYGEYGSFDVYITLPANYVVGASGELTDSLEIKRLSQMASDSSWQGTRYKSQLFPVSSDTLKTIHFKGINTHDFAWFADKRFNVVQSEIILPNTGSKVAVNVLFTNSQSALWKNANNFASRAIIRYSEWISDYPYNTFTVVQSPLAAGSGMEYPGLAVIGRVQDSYELDVVITHEAAHNWFYSALGSNERSHPYMDESITSSYELRYMDMYYPDKKLWKLYFSSNKLARLFKMDQMPMKLMTELDWLLTARNNLEQPINLPADEFSDDNYGTMVYNKGGQGFTYLRASLGDSLFDASIQKYYRNWKYKHPLPNDLRETFEQQTSKDLSWFFDDFLGTTKRLDYKTIRLKNNTLLVRNKGQLNAPLHIAGMKSGAVQFEQWTEGFSGRKWISLPKTDATEIIIDPFYHSPELFRQNNNIRTSGIFPKTDPIKAQFLFTLEEPSKRKLIYIPVINWNKENGVMLGLAMHNGLLKPKTIEYFLMPFFSFGNKEIAGLGTIAYRFIPVESPVRLGIVSIEGSRFAALGGQSYHRLKLGLDLHFSKSTFTSPYNHRAFGNLVFASDLSRIRTVQPLRMLSYLELGYEFSKASMIHPFSLLTLLESGASFQKMKLELNYRYSYNTYNTGLDVRFLVGIMLKSNADNPFYNLAPGGRTGREQYLYEGIYPDRFSVFPKTFWSRQMNLSEGGIVSYINDSLGYSNWIASISFSSNLPGITGKLPVKPFLNLLLTDQRTTTGIKPSLLFEAGFKVGIWNLFEIYFPVFVSDQLSSGSETFKDRIRFVLSIESFQKMKRN